MEAEAESQLEETVPQLTRTVEGPGCRTMYVNVVDYSPLGWAALTVAAP